MHTQKALKSLEELLTDFPHRQLDSKHLQRSLNCSEFLQTHYIYIHIYKTVYTRTFTCMKADTSLNQMQKLQHLH